MTYYRNPRILVIADKTTKEILHTRKENDTLLYGRITKPIYKLLTEGNAVAFYQHKPTLIKVPTIINKRYYVKTQKVI